MNDEAQGGVTALEQRRPATGPPIDAGRGTPEPGWV